MRKGQHFHRAPSWMSDEERFWFRVQKMDQCWLWMGAKSTKGYSRFRIKGKTVEAYRWIFERTVCPVPQGFELDHVCRNHACVRPSHLEIVTRRLNVLRGVSPAAEYAKQDTCVHGHPWTEENTYIRKRGGRRCRTCHRANFTASLPYVREVPK